MLTTTMDEAFGTLATASIAAFLSLLMAGVIMQFVVLVTVGRGTTALQETASTVREPLASMSVEALDMVSFVIMSALLLMVPFMATECDSVDLGYGSLLRMSNCTPLLYVLYPAFGVICAAQILAAISFQLCNKNRRAGSAAVGLLVLIRWLGVAGTSMMFGISRVRSTPLTETLSIPSVTFRLGISLVIASSIGQGLLTGYWKQLQLPVTRINIYLVSLFGAAAVSGAIEVASLRYPQNLRDLSPSASALVGVAANSSELSFAILAVLVPACFSTYLWVTRWELLDTVACDVSTRVVKTERASLFVSPDLLFAISMYCIWAPLLILFAPLQPWLPPVSAEGTSLIPRFWQMDTGLDTLYFEPTSAVVFIMPATLALTCIGAYICYLGASWLCIEAHATRGDPALPPNLRQRFTFLKLIEFIPPVLLFPLSGIEPMGVFEKNWMLVLHGFGRISVMLMPIGSSISLCSFAIAIDKWADLPDLFSLAARLFGVLMVVSWGWRSFAEYRLHARCFEPSPPPSLSTWLLSLSLSLVCI